MATEEAKEPNARNLQQELEAVLMALEAGGEELGVRGLLLRGLLKVVLPNRGRKPGETLPDDWPLEACREASVDPWPARGPTEGAEIEGIGLGVRATVRGECYHAQRCRRQRAEGYALGCIRSLEFEAAINAKGRTQYGVVTRDLDPGQRCIIDLRPALSPNPLSTTPAALLSPGDKEVSEKP